MQLSMPGYKYIQLCHAERNGVWHRLLIKQGVSK